MTSNSLAKGNLITQKRYGQSAKEKKGQTDFRISQGFEAEENRPVEASFDLDRLTMDLLRRFIISDPKKK